MTAVLFGSISTLADTSELQRQAFNDAFAHCGLDWVWSREEYRQLLQSSGGQARIGAFADQRGQHVDAAAIHQTKSEFFQKSLQDSRLQARPGVVGTIQQAKAKGYPVALITTTAPENVSSMLTALAPDIQAGDFDLVLDSEHVTAPKPDEEAYVHALASLGVSAADAVAIEDNLGGVASARAAGLRVVAFPNENTAGQDFSGVDHIVDRVALSRLEDDNPEAHLASLA